MSSAANYNPNEVGVKGTVFGLPFTEENSSIVILPVPWDATVSYAAGTADGPQAILDASVQLDLAIDEGEAPWKRGIWMAPIENKIRAKSQELRNLVEPYIDCLESGEDHPQSEKIINAVNVGTAELKELVKSEALHYINKGQVVGLLGGDHGCPLGYIETMGERHKNFGVLQIDAHMDLRRAYEGFTHSHASIMYNALKIPSITKLVQVGIRDFCEEEMKTAHKDDRVSVFFDQQLKKRRFEGETWQTTCEDIVSQLPQKVYVSFDIDGLNPSLCPGTGTPVPGGLAFEEAVYLLNQLKASGRQVIGFDLSEVAPQTDDREWNANVGARVLFALCGVV